MRMRFIRLVAAAAFLALLAGCGPKGADRVDVTWRVDPPPRWALYPGARQEIPCPWGAEYEIDVYRDGKVFSGGTVAVGASGLTFKPFPRASEVAVERPERFVLTLTVALPPEEGKATGRQRLLRVEKRGGSILFVFLKS